MQERRRVRDKQEESYRMQSLPPEEMSSRRHVKVWLAIRSQIELVQNPLPLARAAATAATIRGTIAAAAAAAAATSLPAWYSRSTAVAAAAT